MKYATKKDAARAWVNGFNAIPQDMALQSENIWEEWEFFGRRDECEIEEGEDEFGSVGIPMWGTFWSMGEWIDEYWLDRNRETVAALGFTICENYERGWLLLGIDGAGYDFYENHWIPLYEARGLKWHQEADDE
jgi:hypothetical protein